MDHLLDLLDDQEDSISAISSGNISQDEPHQSQPNRQRDDPAIDSNQSSVCVDDKIGIRMIQRKISSLDTLHLLTEYPYHSPAQLASYSLQNLNKLLVDPASVVDASTVAGKTSLITLGLIFYNTGSRVSQAGNAFCKIEIGNLYTGPTVSILLFGSAIQHCKLKPGTVVAVINPRLLPKNNNNTRNSSEKTTICLSLSDKEQLQNIAQARDYGICKAMCRAKVNGQWTENGKRCRNYVDKRQSEYCKQHLKQQSNKTQQRKSGGSLQQLRNDRHFLPTATGRRMHPPGVPIQKQGNQAASWPAQSASLKRPHSRVEQKRATNSLLNSTRVVPSLSNSGSLGNGQRRSAQSSLLPNTTHLKTQPYNPLLQNQPISNPYTSSARTRGPSMTKRSITPNVTTAASQSTKRLVTSDALLRRQKKKKPKAQCRSINTTDLSGFDGSVRVPQPSKLFQTKNRTAPALLPGTSAPPTSVERSIQDIRAQQQLAAAKIRRNQNGSTTNSLLSNNLSARKTVAPKLTIVSQRQSKTPGLTMASRDAARDSLFGGDIDLESAINAKSQYAEAAESEEYARSRQVVNELEEEESKRDSKQKKKNGTKKQAPIDTSYTCNACRRTFRMLPKACQRAGHAVKTVRTLRETSSVSDQRLALSNSAASDGGLRLGQGLEWSKQWKN